MLSNDPAEKPQQSSSPSGAADVPVMEAGKSIEVAPGGSGTINDPPASDTKPPGVTDDFGYLSHLA